MPPPKKSRKTKNPSPVYDQGQPDDRAWSDVASATPESYEAYSPEGLQNMSSGGNDGGAIQRAKALREALDFLLRTDPQPAPNDDRSYFQGQPDIRKPPPRGM